MTDERRQSRYGGDDTAPLAKPSSTPYADMIDGELMRMAGVQGGSHLEGMQRLRVTIERLNGTGTVLTCVVILLILVQIAIAVWPRR